MFRLFLFLLFSGVVMPIAAYAQDMQWDKLFDPNRGVCANSGAAEAIWLERIVNCFAKTPDGAIYVYTGTLLDGLQPAYIAILVASATLATAIFGAKMASGMLQNVKRDTLLFVLKLTGAVFFVAEFDTFHEMLIGFIYEFSNVTTAALGQLGDTCDTGAEADLWRRWDCMYKYLLGITGNALMLGIIPMIFLFLVLPGPGLLIFVTAIGFIIMILLAGLRAIYVYFVALIALTFMLLLAPFFISTIFFANTQKFIQSYLKLILSYTLQPMMLFAVMGMQLVVVDYMIFEGPGSLYAAFSNGKTVPDHSDYFTRAVFADSNGVNGLSSLSKESSTGMNAVDMDPEITTADEYKMTRIEYALCMREKSVNQCSPDLIKGLEDSMDQAKERKIGGNMEVGFVVNTMDEDRLKYTFNIDNVGQYMGNILVSILTVIILTYIMYVMIEAVPKMSHELVSQSFRNSNIAQAKMLGESQIRRGVALTQMAAKTAASGGGNAGEIAKKFAEEVGKNFAKQAGRYTRQR